MIGFVNISAHDGWAIAGLGITIVFAGLIFLSIVIAQLHKILEMIGHGYNYFQKKNGRGQKKKFLSDADFPKLFENEPKPPIIETMADTIKNYQILTRYIGDPFSLPKLIDLAEKRGLSRPWSTVDKLLGAEIIVPDGNGYFTWKN